MSIEGTVQDIEDEEQKILADALQRYTTYKEIVGGLIDKLLDAETDVSKHLIPQLKELRKAEDFLLEERAKLNERRRTDAGQHRGHAIDFEQARAEIGGRLDRLRRARCPKGLLK